MIKKFLYGGFFQEFIVPGIPRISNSQKTVKNQIFNNLQNKFQTDVPL